MSNLLKLKADEIYAIYGLIETLQNAKTSKRYPPLPIILILPLRSNYEANKKKTKIYSKDEVCS